MTQTNPQTSAAHNNDELDDALSGAKRCHDEPGRQRNDRRRQRNQHMLTPCPRIRLAASIASAPLIDIFFGSQPRSAQVPPKGR
jgi:hypothetical protein